MRTATLTMRLTPDEKALLTKLAEERDVTLTWALYEGARLYLEDARNWGQEVLPGMDMVDEP